MYKSQDQIAAERMSEVIKKKTEEMKNATKEEAEAFLKKLGIWDMIVKKEE